MKCWICCQQAYRKIGDKWFCDDCIGVVNNLTVETLERIDQKVKKEVEEYHANG